MIQHSMMTMSVTLVLHACILHVHLSVHKFCTVHEHHFVAMECRYEEERLPRVKTVYVMGASAASSEDKEKYLYKPTFKPLWRRQVPLIAARHVPWAIM